MRALFATTACAFLLASPALADDDQAPPADAKPLSEILQTLEQESGFSHFEDIEWDDGRWEIDYRANDRRVEVKVDPVSGEAR